MQRNKAEVTLAGAGGKKYFTKFLPSQSSLVQEDDSYTFTSRLAFFLSTAWNWGKQSLNSTMHLGYKNLDYPRSQIAKHYRFTRRVVVYVTGIIDSMRSSLNKQDIIVRCTVVGGGWKEKDC